MRSILAITLCAVLACMGCRRRSAPPPEKIPETSAPRPAPAPATERVARPAPAPQPQVSVEEKLAGAQRRLGPELRIIRKFRWQRKPNTLVISAAEKVFGGRAGPDADAVNAGKADFVGMTETQVKALVGNPKRKEATPQGAVWVYEYAFGQREVTGRLTVKDGRVISSVTNGYATPELARLAPTRR